MYAILYVYFQRNYMVGTNMKQLADINVLSFTPIITPRQLKAELPISPESAETVAHARQVVHNALECTDQRIIGIVGPCSIHDTEAALDYAQRLQKLREDISDRIFLLMRTYFEKPRTTVGWKGLLSDPFLDGSHDVPAGLRKARELLLKITALGVPTATELLDPIVPQYIDDLVSWASIGARTSESQTHREMASGLSMPIGFKNSTDGNLQIAIDAMVSSCHPHHFLGIDSDGSTCVVATRGNCASHIILRGGRGRPNYDPVTVTDTEERIRKAGLEPRIMVDCSHANCGKRPVLQGHVLHDVIEQRLEGMESLFGFMMESNLKAGSQKIPADIKALEYGVSITDPCLDWDSTEQLLRKTYERLAGML